MIKPRLVMHYAPGVLAVLRREDCPGQEVFGGRIGHNTCGCDKHYQIFKIVNIRVVSDDEKPGLLELSWIRKDEFVMDATPVPDRGPRGDIHPDDINPDGTLKSG